MASPALSRSRVALGALLLVYGIIVAIYIGAVPGGSDNSGYFNEARLFARHEIHAHPRILPDLPSSEAPPYLYVPLGFKPDPDGSWRMVPTYPPGLPLMLVPVKWVVGWPHAGDIVILIHSLAGIALMFALGRICGLPATWSLFGAVLLAASPLYLFTSLQALSDVPATVWATAAVLAVLKSRERSTWALVAGISLGVGFLVRPSNFLVGLPVAIAVGVSPRRWLLLVAGALPGIAVFMAINHVAYGNAFESGYGAIGTEFHKNLVSGTLRFCMTWLPLLFSPIVIAFPAVLGLSRSRPRITAVLLSWVVAFLAFYAPYRWTHESWWFLRFLLPAVPGLIVGGLLVAYLCLEGLQASLSQSQRRLFAGLLVFTALGSETVQMVSLSPWTIGRGERKYGRVSAWLNANVPKNSVMLVSQFSGSMYYFTDFTYVRGDEIDPNTARRIQKAVQAENRPLYAVLYRFEADLVKTLPAKWELVRTFDDVLVLRCVWPGK